MMEAIAEQLAAKEEERRGHSRRVQLNSVVPEARVGILQTWPRTRSNWFQQTIKVTTSHHWARAVIASTTLALWTLKVSTLCATVTAPPKLKRKFPRDFRRHPPGLQELATKKLNLWKIKLKVKAIEILPWRSAHWRRVVWSSLFSQQTLQLHTRLETP